MEGFEPSRRLSPTYRISSADPSATWVHLLICARSKPDLADTSIIITRIHKKSKAAAGLYSGGPPDLNSDYQIILRIILCAWRRNPDHKQKGSQGSVCRLLP